MAYPTDPIYKLCNSPIEGTLVNIKKRLEDGRDTFIPLDEANTDYQEYKLWLADGNTPEAAD